MSNAELVNEFFDDNPESFEVFQEWLEDKYQIESSDAECILNGLKDENHG